MFKPVDQKENFPELENQVTKFWKENHIFEKSVDERPADNRYVFYDGPPFITGTPHYGSLLPSIAKDVVPRYQTMKGHRVERVWGWDCHGLPIETKVEKNLGIKNRRDIEKYGIQHFVDECYKYTRSTSAEWRWYIDKIGRWVDFDNSYKTMDQDYMETVMWVFKQLMDKKLIYEGVRTSLYCTRCGTPISNFEIAMDNSYADMEDPAVTIKFPILEGEYKGVSILAWTTTPWTLPSNKALVLDPKEEYVVANVQKLNSEIEKSWMIKELPKDLTKGKSVNITQAYLENYQGEVDKDKTVHNVRIRKIADKFELTIKYFAGDREESGRNIEVTKEITKEEYIELIKTAAGKVVKIRYYYPLDNGLTAEVDVYQNELKGMQFVEVEFPSLKAEQEFKAPEWFGKEVTNCKACAPRFMFKSTVEQLQAELEAYTEPAHDYSAGMTEEKVIVAKKRVDEVFKGMGYTIEKEFKGKELLGLKYEPPFAIFPASDREHRVYEFKDMVTMEEGTGVVHSAPGFGDVDTRMGQTNKIDIAMSVDGEGNYIEMMGKYKGMFYKSADPILTEDLQKSGKLFKSERIVHRFPYCYRCQTPLMQKAQPSWFVDIAKLRPDLLKNNEAINWVPDHLKDGRFKKGISVAPDWGISRSRFWATPMPVWQREEQGKVVERVVIGSRDELRDKAVQPITKITFVRHARRDKAFPDGELDKEGWEQVEELNKLLKDQKFDAVFASPVKRCVQTVTEIAKLQNLEIQTNELFGSLAEQAEFKTRAEKIEKELKLERVADAPADVIEKFFNLDRDYIKTFAEQFKQFLEANKGKSILVATHGANIDVIRHISEGKTLSDVSAMAKPYGKPTIMYFNGGELMDLHRPKIDNITLKGKTGELVRVPEVLDVWMDSASMPFAQNHYPFADKAKFDATFPADFIIEYIAQTRAWFYVMHVIGTALKNKNSFKNVVTTGVIFGTDGRKMSKSYGNYPDPKATIEKYGAEPLRLYMMGSQIMVGEDMNMDENGLKDQQRNIILPLWNSYSFFVTYSNMFSWKPKAELVSNLRARPDKSKLTWDHIPFNNFDNKLDQWLVARLQLAIRNFSIGMDAYNIPAAVREIPAFVDDMSKWYIRRSRERFANHDFAAFDTMYYVFVELAKMIAPITPFLAEALYQNLVISALPDQKESIHLTDFPVADLKFLENNEKLLAEMQAVREIVNLGQSLRVQNGLKVRQPLAEIKIKINEEPTREYELEQWMKELIMDELNIKVVDEVHELGEQAKWVNSKTEDGRIEISINTELSLELKREGIVRELVRQIQSLRKDAGFTMGERILLAISCDVQEITDAIDANLEEIKKSVNADSLSLTKTTTADFKEVEVNKQKLLVKLN